MEKVKLTQEQADAIERLRKHWDDDVIIARSVKGRSFGQPYNACYRRLEEISIYELARAIDKGFKIEPQFKVGDWVANPQGVIGQIEKIEHHFGDRKYLGKWYDIKVVEMDCYEDVIERHATPEEIEKEKQRRWWAKHGRKPWELKQGDVLHGDGDDYAEIVHKANSVVEFKDGEYYSWGFIKDNYKVLSFAGDRKDIVNDAE